MDDSVKEIATTTGKAIDLAQNMGSFMMPIHLWPSGANHWDLGGQT